MGNTVFIKLTGAIVVGGEVVSPPAIVELSNAEARDILNRGKGRVATEHDGPVSARTMSAEHAEHAEIAAFNADAASIRADNANLVDSEAPALDALAPAVDNTLVAAIDTQADAVVVQVVDTDEQKPATTTRVPRNKLTTQKAN